MVKDNIKFIIVYIFLTILTIVGFKWSYDYWYKESFHSISCGEALFRHNGSAAPRDNLEVKQYYDCLIRNIKKWHPDGSPDYLWYK